MGKAKEKALTDAIIAKALKREGVFKLTDGGGLQLHFNNPGGVPSWRVRYRQDGEDFGGTLGHWPDMSIAGARRACAAKRKGEPAKPATAPRATPAPAQAQQTAPGRVVVPLRDTLRAAGAAVAMLDAWGWRWDGARWDWPTK